MARKEKLTDAQREIAPSIGDEAWLLDPNKPLAKIMKKLSESDNEGFFGVWAEEDGTVRGGLFALFDPFLDREGASMGEHMMSALGCVPIGFRYNLGEVIEFLESKGGSEGLAHWRHAGGHYRVIVTAGAEKTAEAVAYYERAFASAP